MPRKKTNSPAMDPRIEEVLERRLKESEDRNQQRLNETLTKVEELIAAMHLSSAGQFRPGDPRAKEKPNNTGNNGDGERRLRKVDLPVFNGEDATGWLTKIERFFKVRKIDDSEKLDAALMAMEGEALSWMQWWEANSEVLTWDGLKEAILRRFQPTVVTNAFEMLMNVKQEGTVREYRKKFESIASHIKIQDPELFSGMFSNGLRDDVRAEVRLQRPKNLADMMEIALLAEEKLGSVGRYGARNTGGFKNGSKPSTDATAVPKGSEPSKTWQYANTRSVGGKEIEEKRKKGLCYTCDEKYVPGHVCKNKVLRILYVEETNGEDEEGGKEEEEKEEIVWEGSMKSLQLCSMAGLSSNCSFMMKGLIGILEILVLVDCGATHSFVSEKLVEEQNLMVQQTPPCWVKIGNGQRIMINGVCRGVELHLQGLKVKVDCFVFPLDGEDLVLGIDWLGKLGSIKANFKELTLKVKVGKETICLKGDPTLSRREATAKEIMLEGQAQEELFIVDCRSLKLTDADQVAIPEVIQAVISDFESLFNETGELPPARPTDHAIVLKEGASIPNLRPYRYPHFQKNEIERLVADMLKTGIIRPSTSPYSSPIILVKKKDGSWRFCVDYRALNKLTVPNKFPIPLIDELLDELNGAVVFSKLDLKSGYHQIRMRPEDIPKTAFRTHEGHYEYMVMPFGLTNAPSTFQALMNEVLKPFLWKFALVFFDDILIYSRSVLDHAEHLRKFFDVLRENHLIVNKKKCDFGVTKVEYLGHLVAADGVSADPKKVSAMVEWPIPKDIKGLRGFLGLTGYYRRFVKDYGSIARPLTELLKSEKWCWTNEADDAFNQLKHIMTTLPVLRMPDFTKPFVLETDASSKGVGAVLMQEERPIAYFSQKLSLRAQQKSTYERELMAIVLAVQKWRHYLLGQQFIVRSDQQSLQFLNDQSLLGGEQVKWTSKLLGFDFVIQYKAGSANKVADGLSRQMIFAAISSITLPEWSEWEEEIRSCPDLQALVQQVVMQPAESQKFSIKQGFLYKGTSLVLPKTFSRIPTILKEFHASLQGGHSGFFRTFKRIEGVFYWPGMKRDIREFIRHCQQCQQSKVQTLAPAGLLQPLPIPTKVWTDVSMDFIGGLPRVGRQDTILVVIDRLTKYAHFILLGHPYTASDVAHSFISGVIKLHGFPESIVTDRDRIFLSQFWRELFKQAGTKLKYSTAFHPQSDGQTEVTNRCLEIYLRCYVGEHPKSWTKWIDWAELWFNTNYNISIGMTPYKALYGRDPNPIIKGPAIPSNVEEVKQLYEERDTLLDKLHQNLTVAQQKMKKQADNRRRDITLDVDDWVYLKAVPYRWKSLAERRNEKLSPRFYGPYRVVERIGQVAYKLELPPGCRIHPVFHVSRLKKTVPGQYQPQQVPPALKEDGALQPEVEDVLSLRYNSKGEAEVLVKWKDLAACDNSWENAEKLLQLFPNQHLEDKVKALGGGIDRPFVNRVYYRRRKDTSN